MVGCAQVQSREQPSSCPDLRPEPQRGWTIPSSCPRGAGILVPTSLPCPCGRCSSASRVGAVCARVFLFGDSDKYPNRRAPGLGGGHSWKATCFLTEPWGGACRQAPPSLRVRRRAELRPAAASSQPRCRRSHTCLPGGARGSSAAATAGKQERHDHSHQGAREQGCRVCGRPDGEHAPCAPRREGSRGLMGPPVLP